MRSSFVADDPVLAFRAAIDIFVPLIVPPIPSVFAPIPSSQVKSAEAAKFKPLLNCIWVLPPAATEVPLHVPQVGIVPFETRHCPFVPIVIFCGVAGVPATEA